MLPINRNPSARDLRGFARLWFPLFVAFVGIMLWWRLDAATAAVSVWVAGGLLAVGVLASAPLARRVFVGLQIVTYPIGLVVSTVALAVLFYLVFTPIGLVMRLAGRDPLRLRTRGEPSHWQPYQQDDDVERSLRQF
jgi:ABC-type uncharacterized transport system permease subunit